MKNEFIQILKEQNDLMNGGLIQQPIEDYVKKIMTYANILTYIEIGAIAAFIAYYCNDPGAENAYLTMLCVKQEFAGKGLGKLLLNASIQDLNNKKFHSYLLEVSNDNFVAKELYEKTGFKAVSKLQNTIKMKKDFTL